MIMRTTVGALSLAVTLGIVLALWHLRTAEGRRGPPWLLGLLHGAVGVVGLAGLLLLLQGPPRGVAMGVGSFGITAAVLFGLAVAAGVSIPRMLRRSPQGAAVIIAVHAGLAITAYVLFVAWSSIGG
jgi:hypothetical protein